MMSYFWILLCVYVVNIVIADEAPGEFSEWKEVLCEKNSAEFGEEMDKCFTMDSQTIQDTVKKCVNKILPSIGSKTYDFLTAACAEKSVFDKLDECMKENEEVISAVPEEESAESLACMKELAEKYGL